MKSPSLTLGPISLSARTKTTLHQTALALADRALSALSHARPSLAHWRDTYSLVYPSLSSDGSLEWNYTNPRDLFTLTSDLGRCDMGSGGPYPSQTIAYSRALSHMIQIDPDGIPDELPDTLHPADFENLSTLRRYQREGVRSVPLPSVASLLA